MISYIVTIFVLGLIFALSILYLVRHSKLYVPYALWWILIAVLTLVGSMFPQVLDDIGLSLGVNYPPILFILMALLVLALRMVFVDIHRTHLEVQLRDLAQDQAQLIGRVVQLEHLVAQHIKLPSPITNSKTM